jgi:hypothetical protein
LGGGKGNGKHEGVTLEQEIYRVGIEMVKLTKEEMHLSGECVDDLGEPAYDSMLMVEQILERSYEK